MPEVEFATGHCMPCLNPDCPHDKSDHMQRYFLVVVSEDHLFAAAQAKDYKDLALPMLIVCPYCNQGMTLTGYNLMTSDTHRMLNGAEAEGENVRIRTVFKEFLEEGKEDKSDDSEPENS